MAPTPSPVPHIVVPPPGPRARAIIAQDQAHASPSYAREYPLVVDHAAGTTIWDVDGNAYLDGNAGIAVCTTGHAHPRVVAAVQEQAGRFLHYSGTDFYYPLMAQLVETLARIAPGTGPHRVFPTNSGTEAVEAAIKLARHATGRPHLLSFYGGFHGRTYGALSLTASKPVQHRGFRPLLPEVSHIPYADCFRCPLGAHYPACALQCLRYVEQTVFARDLDPSEVAAVIVEPIQGEGGYVVPPDDWLVALRELTRRHGILLIADEVQSGAGRTGRMWAVEHSGIEPDILCLAKGIASGLPLGAMVARADLMASWGPGAHGSTFGGNPLACAAALATIELLEEGLIAHAAQVGARLLDGLKALQPRYPLLGDVRGRGLMIGVEIVDPAANAPASAVRDALVRACFERGLLILHAGPSAIRFSPPLILSTAEVEVALSVFESALGSPS